MRRTWLLTVLLPSSVLAASGFSGYVQEHFTYRTQSKALCGAVEACSVMVNEQRLQVLGEWQPASTFGAVLRVDALHDSANQRSRALVREGYVDMTPSPYFAIRFGRQVITWGVADYLFVNDMFPKNYDAFFTGKPFDHMKEAVDALKINGLIGETETELVLSRPQRDEMPSSSRFLSAVLPGSARIEHASRHGTDGALRLATKLGRLDSSFYAGYYRNREAGLYAVPGNAVRWKMQPTTHVGASVTGNIANGIGLAELAYLATKSEPANMNPYLPGRHIKALIGYARELGQDLSMSMQYHHEYQVNYASHMQSLASMTTPAPRTRQTAYVRLHKRLLHQTMGLGVQLFASGDGGRYVNPFVSYSIIDGLNVEAGANWFSGPADSRYGMMKRDSNAYTSLRYSF